MDASAKPVTVPPLASAGDVVLSPPDAASTPPTLPTITSPPLTEDVRGDSADAGVARDYVFGGLTKDGRVVATFWDGSLENLVLLDPKSGKATFVGYLDDLLWWQRQLIYDDRTRTAYVLGSSVQNERYLYTLPLDDTTKRTVVMTAPPPSGAQLSYVLAGTTLTGQLIAAYSTGAGEAIALLDPATGSAMDVGAFDGLAALSGGLAYDAGNGTVYALGLDGSGTARVFSYAQQTRRAGSAILSGDGGRVEQAFGVTLDGQLLVAYWDDVEAVALLDPLTGRAHAVGAFAGLSSWSTQVQYGGAGGSVVAYGQDARGDYRFYEITLGD
ncbi:MAG TPA: hypothetical protein VHC69_16795 [Polyangiaceae bacterium]|nr:hypothetical protein [Polyangiaceae bacterium]